MKLAAAGGGAGVLVLAWASIVEPRWLETRRLEVELPGLPAAWDGQQVGLLADLQVGIQFGNTGTVRKAIRRLIEARPAVVVLAGDFVYEAVRRPEPALGTVSSIVAMLPEAGIPTFAVLGNHDYGEEGTGPERRQLARRVAAALGDAGVRVLENEAVPVGSPKQPAAKLYVVGIGPRLPDRDDPPRAVEQVPNGAARIVFMHNPSSFGELPAGSAPLALAGHTHGGQLRMPFVPRWTLGRLTVPWPEYLDGWLDGLGRPGNRLYVNRGIGFSRWPVRFGCRPELTLIRLRSPRG